jgi:hypothetical protein
MLHGLQTTTREKGKGKRLARLRGSSPPSKESNLLALYLSKRPSFSENLKWLFSGSFDSLYFRGLEKGKRQRESWGARLSIDTKEATKGIEGNILWRREQVVST